MTQECVHDVKRRTKRNASWHIIMTDMIYEDDLNENEQMILTTIAIDK